MKAIFLYVLLSAVLISSGCSTGESHVRTGFDFSKIDKVAVLAVQGTIMSEAAKNQISDFVVMELLKKGYAPIERVQVKKLLTEQRFQASDVTSNQDAAQAGRVLNVPAVLIVNIPNFKEEISMTIKLINVEDGSILWMGSGTGTTGRTLATLLGAAAGAGAGVAVTGEDDQVAGGIIGGVLGAGLGQALTPQTALKAQQIIKLVCQDLPYR
ncbi:MAG: hypothetical protein FVQ80_03270 [Planctomycetes bacterium]|nr:hypothetical protein [Planctomycetota bacterium]